MIKAQIFCLVEISRQKNERTPKIIMGWIFGKGHGTNKSGRG